MSKTIKIAETPNLIGKPVVNFTVEEHNAMVWNKGYDAIIESAVRCPCKTKDNPNQTVCHNCLGIGWVLINPIQDRVVMEGINSETKFKEWTAEKLGTIAMSFARRDYALGYMDRITIVDSSAPYSEVLHPVGYDNTYFAFTIYSVDSVIEVFQFIDTDQPLRLLSLNDDYTFDDHKLIFTQTPVADITALKAITGYNNGDKSLVNSSIFYEFDSESTLTPDDDNVVLPDDIIVPNPGRWIKQENFTVSIRYKHKLQYHILDIPHVIRNSYRKDNKGRDELQKLPVQAIGRLVHYVVDRPNFDGDNIFDNSYQEI